MSALEETADAIPEWQPGDELYPRSAHPYSQYVFNYRHDSTAETCSPCPDSATWPEPRSGQRLSETDLLEAFINECREARP